MNDPQFSLDNIPASFDQLLQQVMAASVTNLEQFAAQQEQRTLRLVAIQGRLKTELGENHPQVVALGEAAAFAHTIKQSLQTTAKRATSRPKVNPNQWMVFGTILNSERQPVSGVQVRVFDRDRIFDDLLGATQTDEYGDFAVVYREQDFVEIGEGLPELYIMVEDKAGKLLYSSRDNLRYNSGRAEYFEIVLPETGTST
jgi:Transthyretin-like family